MKTPQQVLDALVTFWGEGRTFLGNGVRITPDVVLTAAHVCRGDDGRLRPELQVRPAHGANDPAASLACQEDRVQFHPHDRDAAVVRLDTAFVGRSSYLRLASVGKAGQKSGLLHTSFCLGPSTTKTPGADIAFRATGSHSAAGGLWKLFPHLEPGESGSGFRVPETNRLIGIAAGTEKSYGWMLPIDAVRDWLLHVVPELKAHQQATHREVFTEIFASPQFIGTFRKLGIVKADAELPSALDLALDADDVVGCLLAVSDLTRIITPAHVAPRRFPKSVWERDASAIRQCLLRAMGYAAAMCVRAEARSEPPPGPEHVAAVQARQEIPAMVIQLEQVAWEYWRMGRPVGPAEPESANLHPLSGREFGATDAIAQSLAVDAIYRHTFPDDTERSSANGGGVHNAMVQGLRRTFDTRRLQGKEHFLKTDSGTPDALLAWLHQSIRLRTLRLAPNDGASFVVSEGQLVTLIGEFIRDLCKDPWPPFGPPPKDKP